MEVKDRRKNFYCDADQSSGCMIHNVQLFGQ